MWPLGVILLLIYMIPDGLSNNSTDTDGEIWDTLCPASCSCAKRGNVYNEILLRTLDCSNLGLRQLPDNVSMATEAAVLDRNRLDTRDLRGLELMSNLTVLDISANHLYSLESWGLSLPNLYYLSLDRNELEYLHNCTFRGFRRLRVLSVSHNNIELMHNDAFCGLQELTNLDMSRNRIYEVTPYLFRHTASLEYLDLQENNIHNLRRGDFTYLSHLHTLYLNNNHLKHLQDSAFTGLEGLQQLYLQDNPLNVIPSQPLRQFRALELLDLSNTRVSLLKRGCLRDVNVTFLRLRRITELHLVEKGAFKHMLHLRTLELADNPFLTHLDIDSLSDLPFLEILHLNNNSLTSLDQGTIAALPSLEELHLYGNPFYCDCAILWLRDEILLQSMNLSLARVDSIQCKNPMKFKGMSINDDTLSSIPTSCSPRIINLFPPSQSVALGDSLRVDCRAVGQPRPLVDWRMPPTQQDVSRRDVTDGLGLIERVMVTTEGSLLLDYIQGKDHGQYTCVATNSRGRAERPLQIIIKNMAANVLILRVTQAAITVTWKSTQSTHSYELLWRPAGTNASYSAVPIKPYMRSYTANQLKASSRYEFCLAVLHNQSPVRINCTIVTTHGADFGRLGIVSTREYILGGSIGCISAIVLIGCLVTWAARRYNRRRRLQEELYGDNLSQLFLASLDSLSDTTPITYENRAAEIFDDDDIEEIRNAAAAASAATGKWRRLSLGGVYENVHASSSMSKFWCILDAPDTVY